MPKTIDQIPQVLPKRTFINDEYPMVSANNENSFESSSAHDTAMPKTGEKSRHHKKSIAMKKYFVFLVFFSFITCLRSFSQEADFVIARNDDITIKAEDGTLVLASDVYSKKSALKRKLQLVNPKTKELIGEAFIRLEGADAGENIYDVLNDSPEKFTGTITIDVDGITVFQKQILNGAAEPAVFTSGRSAGELTSGPCTFNQIHNCVSHRIEGMNWWRFGLCLIRAPVCYAQQWAYCIIDVCINGTQYQN